MGIHKQGGRTGAFAGVNSGIIEGCVSNVRVDFGAGGAGFVYENSGIIRSSLSVKGVKKKGAKGFFARNSGNIEKCAYIAGKGAKAIGKDGVEIYKYGNREQYISSDTPPEAVFDALQLNAFRKSSGNDRSFEPDIQANMISLPENGETVVELRTAAELKEMIEKINSGDRAAAKASYRLMNDINMKGARLEPIGISETMPFSGSFDGNGKTISNFTVKCDISDAAGFFGYTKKAVVANLTLDYILKGSKSVVAGGMAGEISGGEFLNCKVLVGVSAGRCTGGFAGKNSGHIRNCYAGGKISGVFPLPWLLAGSTLLLALLVSGGVTYVVKITKSPYKPIIIDPNQVPVISTEPVEPPPAGTSRISIELNQDIYIAASSMVGQMDYVNPRRSTQDVVIRLCITDAELVKRGYDLVACKVRTQAQLSAADYDPEKSYTELYRSGRLQIGYKLSVCKLSPLPNGENLSIGDYDMVMLIDAYDPETNEKSIVNAQAITTIHIVNQ